MLPNGQTAINNMSQRHYCCSKIQCNMCGDMNRTKEGRIISYVSWRRSTAATYEIVRSAHTFSSPELLICSPTRASIYVLEARFLLHFLSHYPLTILESHSAPYIRFLYALLSYQFCSRRRLSASTRTTRPCSASCLFCIPTTKHITPCTTRNTHDVDAKSLHTTGNFCPKNISRGSSNSAFHMDP